MNKICKQCKLDKDILDFRHQIRCNKTYISLVCKKCDFENSKERHLKFRETHRNELRDKNKNYYKENKLEIKERQKDKKKIWSKTYYHNNKKKIQQNQACRVKERYKTEPNFRIRKTVSKAISRTLKLNGHSKRGDSCLKFIEYTMSELKKYLEKQFEPWMNWNNYGKYSAKTWDDNDRNTWTWQIDHIIPQSDLPYISMEDENFKKCWALNNLRPLNAKQNWIDGINRARHIVGGISW